MHSSVKSWIKKLFGRQTVTADKAPVDLQQVPEWVILQRAKQYQVVYYEWLIEDALNSRLDGTNKERMNTVGKIVRDYVKVCKSTLDAVPNRDVQAAVVVADKQEQQDRLELLRAGIDKPLQAPMIERGE